MAGYRSNRLEFGKWPVVFAEERIALSEYQIDELPLKFIYGIFGRFLREHRQLDTQRIELSN
jgi:hypothetical protein